MHRHDNGSLRHSLGLATRPFDDDVFQQMHRATLEVLERTGVHVEDDAAVDLFAEAGCAVDRETHAVRIPPYVVEEALRTTPKQILFAARDPQHDLVLDVDRLVFMNHCEAPFQNDVRTGERRLAVKQDVADTARICDALDHIDIVVAAVSLDDHPLAMEAHRFHAAVQHTTKPVHISVSSAADARAMVEMAAAVVGGREHLRERPIFSVGTGAVSPLSLPKDNTDVASICAEAGVPVNMGSMPLTGATAPATQAGTVVLLNALQLASFTLVQLVRRGAPQWYGCAAETIDMRTGLSLTAAPETAILNAIGIQMARYYRVPSFALALWTESKTRDQQCMLEKTFGAFNAALSGTTILHGAGSLDSGLTNDLGQLVADHELYRWIRRFVGGADVSDTTLLLDDIHAAGHRGEFMSRKSTRAHLGDFMPGGLLDRDPIERWQQSGALTLEARTRDEAQRILAEHRPEPLRGGVLDELVGILNETEARAASRSG